MYFNLSFEWVMGVTQYIVFESQLYAGFLLSGRLLGMLVFYYLEKSAQGKNIIVIGAKHIKAYQH